MNFKKDDGFSLVEVILAARRAALRDRLARAALLCARRSAPAQAAGRSALAPGRRAAGLGAGRGPAVRRHARRAAPAGGRLRAAAQARRSRTRRHPHLTAAFLVPWHERSPLDVGWTTPAGSRPHPASRKSSRLRTRPPLSHIGFGGNRPRWPSRSACRR